MAKGATSRRGAWIGAAFAAFSVMVALGWTYRTDLWALQATREHSSCFLDIALRFFSLPGGVEVSGVALLALLAGLFLYGRRSLGWRVLAAFMVTALLELALKLYLPQAPMPGDALLAEDHTPLVAAYTPYPYPSGHMIRSVILLGALYLLSRNGYLRAGLLVVLALVAANRVYFGAHWASDVVGGALLGLTGLLWAFDLKQSAVS